MRVTPWLAAILVMIISPANADLPGGRAAYMKGDYGTAFNELKPLADVGNPEALVLLSVMHHDGLGRVKKDLGLAFSYALRAAEKDNGAGQVLVGAAYYSGEGVIQNFAQAFVWFDRAANKGIAVAQYRLGVMYSLGEGVRQNKSEGKRLLQLAADQGDLLAKFDLPLFYPETVTVKDNPYANQADIRRLAEAGDSVAQNLLGTFLRLGAPGYKRDPVEAIRWLRLAAEHRDAPTEDAQIELGKMYFRGEGTHENLVLAHMWFNLAAVQGGQDAREWRAKAEAKMTPAQITKAQKLAAQWQASR